MTDVRPGRFLVRLTLVLLLCGAGSCLPTAVSADLWLDLNLPTHGAPATGRPQPTVIFNWAGPAGESMAERCRAALEGRGGEITAALVPDTLALLPVQCLLLDSATFQDQFGSRLPDWGVGVALPGGRTLAIDYNRVPEFGRSVEQVFLHELTHAVIMQAAGETWLPAWFHEGAAMWFSGEWRFTDTIAVVLNGNLPSLWNLQDRFPATTGWADQAYRTSLLAHTALRADHGPDVTARIIAVARRSGQFDAAFQEATGESLEAFVQRFAADMKLRFGWLFTVTRWPTLFVLLAAGFLGAAIARTVRNRRRLTAMDDE